MASPTQAPSSLIDTPEAVASFVSTLSNLPTHPPSLYLDLEGIDLSRSGTVSILQIFILPTSTTHLIDVHTLDAQAFTTPAPTGTTLKSILEDPAIPKAFFDVRCDSNVLYIHFGIDLAGVVDIQLMELATRTHSKRYISGLGKCMERDAPMTAAERQTWMATKESGRRLFAPERGGSYDVFNQRPLPQGIRDYCMQDVQFLPRLWRLYHDKLTSVWRVRVEDAAKARVRESHSAGFVGQGRHMTLGPWG